MLIAKWSQKQGEKVAKTVERILDKYINKYPEKGPFNINKKVAIVCAIFGLGFLTVAYLPIFHTFLPIMWIFTIIGVSFLIASAFGFYIYIKKPGWVQEKYDGYLKRKNSETDNKNEIS